MTEFIILSKDEIMTLNADMPIVCYSRDRKKYVICSEQYYEQQKNESEVES